MKRLKDESGQALIITAFCMTCLFGFAALATDVGLLLREKRMAQTAADGAAVAGASELFVGDPQVSSVAKSAAGLNGFTDGSNGVTVVVNGPAAGGPSIGPHAGNKAYVEVIVSKVQPTAFMSLFGVLNMTPSARAVATYGQTNGCIVTLGSSGPDISIIGAADITVKTCGIADNSSSPSGSKNSALYIQGNATLTAQSIGITGGYQETGGSVNLTPATPITGVVPTSDPLAPKVGTPPGTTPCSDMPANATTLTPGCWNGISVGSNNTLKLAAGQYVINGPLNLSGTATLDGSAGVQLVLYGTTSMGGSTILDLTGSDAYGGIVIWQPASNTSPLNLIGNPGSTIDGIVYAPTAAVSLQGNAGATITVDFVVGTLSLAGNATITSYASVNPNSALKTVRLVE
jgi:Putative Flp pilus-assembly TadE/G-like